MHIYTFIIFIIVFSKTIESQYSQCLNPQRRNGLCVPYDQCSFLVNIATYHYQNPEVRNFLSESRCGYNGYVSFFCCPFAQMPAVQQMKSLLSESSLPKAPICGSDIEDRIVGGTKAKIFDFPWYSLLKYVKPGTSSAEFLCGGSLITNRFVVTAAHCVHPVLLQRTSLIAVRLGEWNLLTNPDCDDSFIDEKVCNAPYIDIGVESAIPHEKYLPHSFNQHNDIALVKMKLKIKFSEFIKPICLQNQFGNLIGQSLTVAGFGRTASAASSNIKLKVNLDVVDNDKCNQVFKVEGRKLNGEQICAGGKKGLDSCKGDSGGPIMKLVTQNRISFWTLVGIVSFGVSPCGSENKPGVYTRVDGFYGWIENKVNSL